MVVGLSWLDGTTFHAFRYEGAGPIQDIGTPTFNSHAKSINSSGVIVGQADTAEGGFAFRRSPGGPIQTFGPNIEFGEGANAINDSGLIVGSGEGAAFTTFLAEGFAYTPDNVLHKLGTLGGGVSQAKDVNNAGIIVGWSWGADGKPRAFRHEGFGPLLAGSFASGGDEIGNLGGNFSEAHAINEAGAIVGRSRVGDLPDSEIHPFLWTPSGGMQDLGTLGGAHAWAWDVNESGQVVGWSTVMPGNLGFDPTHGFIWDSLNGMQDLNDLISPASGLTVDAAYGINDLGWIVGSAFRQSDGLQVPVLLKPVPEPSSLALVALAGLGALRFVRRKKVIGILAAIVCCGAMASDASAQVTNYRLFKEAYYEQTGSNTVALDFWAMDANIQTSPDYANNIMLTPPAPRMSLV